MSSLHLVSETGGRPSQALLHAALRMSGGAPVVWLGGPPDFDLPQSCHLTRLPAPLGRVWFAPRAIRAALQAMPEPSSVFAWDLSMLALARRLWPEARHRWMRLTPPPPALKPLVRLLKPHGKVPFKCSCPQAWLKDGLFAAWQKVVDVIPMSDQWQQAEPPADEAWPDHVALCGLQADAWTAMDALVRAESGAGHLMEGVLRFGLRVSPKQPGLLHAKHHLRDALAQMMGGFDGVQVWTDPGMAAPGPFGRGCRAILLPHMAGGPDDAQALAALLNRQGKIPLIAHDTPALRALLGDAPAARFIPPDDSRRWVAAMAQALGLSAYRPAKAGAA